MGAWGLVNPAPIQIRSKPPFPIPAFYDNIEKLAKVLLITRGMKMVQMVSESARAAAGAELDLLSNH
jgi:hypothetical protein